jgi:hypothetical protein
LYIVVAWGIQSLFLPGIDFVFRPKMHPYFPFPIGFGIVLMVLGVVFITGGLLLIFKWPKKVDP